jgi:DNA polymerase III epsilon subunit-like protein
MKHVMIDIETMGTGANASILSIAAVRFDLNTGEVDSISSINVDLQSCLDIGLDIDASTVLWWMQQSEEARKALLNPSEGIEDALLLLSDLITKEDEVWGNSARFDLGILENAYRKCGIDTPWDFRKERDVRTLVSFAPEIKNKYKPTVEHDPVSDCICQISYCSEIWNTLKK